MTRFYSLTLILLILLAGEEAYSQMSRYAIKKNNQRMARYRGMKRDFRDLAYNAVGVSLNAFNYYGDLSPSPKAVSTDLGLTKPAVGVSFTHRFGPRYQLMGSFTYGAIKGSDRESADPNDPKNGAYRYVRNLSFRNRIAELTAVAQVDLFESNGGFGNRVNWTPYGYAGLAVFHHNPQAQVPETDLLGQALSDAGEWVDLQPLETEGKSYNLYQFAIPFGIGVRFRLADLMDISAEFGFRYTFTDYLDDVSGNYIDLNTFGSDEKAKALSYRSNEITLGESTAIVDEIIANRFTGYTGFTTVQGYGHVNNNGTPNLRGKSDDRDILMLTTIRLNYILAKNYNRAKFR
jgi:hypothetical protein